MVSSEKQKRRLTEVSYLNYMAMGSCTPFYSYLGGSEISMYFALSFLFLKVLDGSCIVFRV